MEEKNRIALRFKPEQIVNKFQSKSGIDLTSIKLPSNSKYPGYKCVLTSKSIHKSKYNENENFAYIDSKREYIISKNQKMSMHGKKRK